MSRVGEQFIEAIADSAAETAELLGTIRLFKRLIAAHPQSKEAAKNATSALRAMKRECRRAIERLRCITDEAVVARRDEEIGRLVMLEHECEHGTSRPN